MGKIPILQLKYFKMLTNKIHHVLHKTKTMFLATKIINIFKQIFKYRSTGLFKPPQGSNIKKGGGAIWLLNIALFH